MAISCCDNIQISIVNKLSEKEFKDNYLGRGIFYKLTTFRVTYRLTIIRNILFLVLFSSFILDPFAKLESNNSETTCIVMSLLPTPIAWSPKQVARASFL